MVREGGIRRLGLPEGVPLHQGLIEMGQTDRKREHERAQDDSVVSWARCEILLLLNGRG